MTNRYLRRQTGTDSAGSTICARDAALSTVSTAQNVEEATEELGVRQLSVKNSDTEFHDTTPNTLAADTRSWTDGRTEVMSGEGVPICTLSRKLKLSEESNHI
jgi:hypothetical protein